MASVRPEGLTWSADLVDQKGLRFDIRCWPWRDLGTFDEDAHNPRPVGIEEPGDLIYLLHMLRIQRKTGDNFHPKFPLSILIRFMKESILLLVVVNCKWQSGLGVTAREPLDKAILVAAGHAQARTVFPFGAFALAAYGA